MIQTKPMVLKSDGVRIGPETVAIHADLRTLRERVVDLEKLVYSQKEEIQRAHRRIDQCTKDTGIIKSSMRAGVSTINANVSEINSIRTRVLQLKSQADAFSSNKDYYNAWRKAIQIFMDLSGALAHCSRAFEKIASTWQNIGKVQ